MMVIHKGRYMLIVLAAVLLLMTACSTSVGTGNGTSSLTVAQVLQNTTKAMKQLNSVHFETNTNGNVQANNSATPTTSTPVTTNVTFTVTGSGDEALPDQESMHVTLSSGTNLAEIVKGNNVYIQNTKGQWYVIDKNQLQGFVGNPFSGTNLPDLNSMLVLAQDAKLTDHGDQSLNGQTLRHITVTFDKTAFKQLLSTNEQLKGMLGKDNVDQVIDSTKNFLSSLDLWIDESTFYIHRTELRLNLDEDLSSLKNMLTPTVTVSTVPSSVTTKFDSIVDFSKFNAPVTITLPANAIPTDNPASIFSGQ